MNDDEMLATLRSSLTGCKESLADVHLDRSADAIRAGARGRRLRRGLAGAGAGGLALGAGLALTVGGAGTTAPSVHVNLDAWSVNTLSGGLVYVDVRALRDPVLLRQTLARAGVPAIVTFGKVCTEASGGDAGNLTRVLGKTAVGGEPRMTIDPAGIPAGSELSIGIVLVEKAPGKSGLAPSFALVKEGSRLTCGVPAVRANPSGKASLGAGGAGPVPAVPAATGPSKPGSAG